MHIDQWAASNRHHATLGVSAGMSVMSMFEVVLFVYLIANGIFHDVRNLKKTVSSYLKGGYISEKVTSPMKTNSWNENDGFDKNLQAIEKIYVSINFRK